MNISGDWSCRHRRRGVQALVVRVLLALPGELLAALQLGPGPRGRGGDGRHGRPPGEVRWKSYMNCWEELGLSWEKSGEINRNDQ